MGDEAVLLTYDRLFNNVLTTNRAKKEIFKGKSMLHAEIFVSSVAMTKKGEWFTNREKMAIENPKEYTFIKASSKVNIHNLKPGWIEKMRREALSKTMFEAEILNIRPGKIADGFYAQLSKKNYYKYKYDIDALGDLTENYVPSSKYDTDLVRGVPLQFNLDFGGRINCGTVSQYLESQGEIRFIKEFFAKNPDKLSDMVKQFIDYYKHHQSSCNVVHLYHDRSGYKSEANSKTTLAEDVENALRSAGWIVINQTPNTNNPEHIQKFRLINEILSEQNPRLPIVRINENQCPNLIISMENAPLTSDDAFKKDKSSERSSTIPQEHATHFSDTLDYCLFWQFGYLLDYDYSDSFIITNI